MKADLLATGEPSLTDADYLDIARQALAQKMPAAVQAILADVEDRESLWRSEDGQTLLIELLGTVLDALSDNNATIAIDIANACPPTLAERSHSLLLLAFFPDGHVSDLAELDDAALLCLAMLTHRMGHRGRAAELLDRVSERAPSSPMCTTIEAIHHHFTATAKTRFRPKLIIWGLDGALWHGEATASEEVAPHAARADLIRAFNGHGIVSAICAQGDADVAQRILERHDLWDAFVFPRISPQPTVNAVTRLIDDMLLRPIDALFVDHDADRRAQVAAALPGIRTVNATSEECDALLHQLLDENRHVTASRVADYRILQARVTDREALSDADFLMQSGIQATYTHRMDNLAFVDRIEELINRADPLNYTETRVVPGTLRDVVMNVSDYDVFSAFIWDKYGHHGLDGLVGVIVYHRPSRRPVHLAFSCRIMHMGVEDFLIKALVQRYGPIDFRDLPKALPLQSSAAIHYVPFEEVREQILATQAPRDWSKIRIRVMSDCMSGGFHHYSRFKDEMDFDNIPRVFTLPAMLDGSHRDQSFPDFLVYNPAIDYMETRWTAVMDAIDLDIYRQAHHAFCDMVIAGNHLLLLLLSPEHADDRFYAILPHMTGAQLKARDKQFNQLWRDAAARHPEHIEIIELNDFVTESDMLTHAYHYSPSILKHMTELTDDWYVRNSERNA